MTFYKFSSFGVQQRIDKRIFLSACLLGFGVLNLFYFVLYRFFGLKWFIVVGLIAVFWAAVEHFSYVFRQKELERVAEYTIAFSPQKISLSTLNKPIVVLERENVRKILRTKQGLIVRESLFRYDKIFVPNTIENFEMLELKLGQWQPIVDRQNFDRFSAIAQTSLAASLVAWCAFVFQFSLPLMIAFPLISLGLAGIAYFGTILGFKLAPAENNSGVYLLATVTMIVLNGGVLAAALINWY